jgi:hypothetical protein
MKKFILLFFLMTVGMTVQAQHKEGDITIQPRIGVTFSTITDQKDIKMKTNLTYGFETEYYFTDKWSVAGGLLFTNQGYKFDYYDGIDKNSSSTAKFNNYYATVPITVNYYVIEGLAVKVGIQPAFRVKTQLKMGDAKLDLDDAMEVLFPTEDVTINKFDLSIPVGFSYEYNKFVFDARYNLGLTKLYKGIEQSSRNSVITLTLGYKL